MDQITTPNRKRTHSGVWYQKICAFFIKHHYVFSKVGMSIVTLFLSMLLLFFLLRMIPGDLVQLYALNLQTERGMTYEQAYDLSVNLLNYNPRENVFVSLFRYCGGLAKGELGQSITQKNISANILIAKKLPWTLLLSACALFISFFVGTAVGGYVAQKRKGIVSKLASAYIALSGSIPDYLVALLLVIVFAYRLKWFPAQNNYDVFVVTPGFNLPFIFDVFKHACLPIMASVLAHTGNWIMQMRGSCIGVLGEDYILAARARGLSSSTIRKRYMKRNAMLPLVTTLGMSFGGLFGGAVLMENIFNYPGIGLEISSRILSKDFMVVQGLIFFAAFMVIMINLIVDLIYPWFDPRVRKE